MAGFARSTSPTPTRRRRSAISCRRRRATRRPARSRSTTSSWTTAGSSTAWTAISAASTSSRWISDTRLPRTPSALHGRLLVTEDSAAPLVFPLGEVAGPFGRRSSACGVPAAGDPRHRLPRRRQDHAGQALPRRSAGRNTAVVVNEFGESALTRRCLRGTPTRRAAEKRVPLLRGAATSRRPSDASSPIAARRGPALRARRAGTERA